jgi:hypothetical protein
MKHRITIDTIQSGQPEPWGAHILVVQVAFEWTPPLKPGSDFVPQFMSPDTARSYLKNLPIGFVENERHERRDPFQSYLDYLKLIDPKSADQVIPNGDPHQALASTWEFKVVTPFTD